MNLNDPTEAFPLQTLRIFHSADWHIGKGLGTIDRTDDFRLFIRDFLELVKERRPDVILLAGDIFDTSMPANSAQRLYYDMIRALASTSVKATVIAAGNHDSQRFLEAPSALLETMNCFVAGESPESQAFILRDQTGSPLLGVAAVPFLREGDVRVGSIDDTDASRAMRFESGVKKHYETVRSFLTEKLGSARVPMIAMGHLFVTGSRLRPDGEPTTPGESAFVGSLRNVTADAFGKEWDYVALGHIHNSQTVDASVPMRYSGSPISLSYSHIKYRHHIVELTFDETGAMTVEELPVKQPREFVRVCGTLSELRTGIEAAGAAHAKPFVEATLTSDECAPNLAEELAAYGEAKGVIVTAVRNQQAARRYEADELNAPSLDDLTPESVFKSFLDERFETTEEAAKAFQTLMPLLNEAVEEVRIGTRPAEESADATAQENNIAGEVRA